MMAFTLLKWLLSRIRHNPARPVCWQRSIATIGRCGICARREHFDRLYYRIPEMPPGVQTLETHKAQRKGHAAATTFAANTAVFAHQRPTVAWIAPVEIGFVRLGCAKS
jgi:hypothetical protein